MIAANFERHYWIPKETERFAEYNVDAKYVRYKQIYKDLAKSSKPRNDYQLRCNACIAIAVAPDLFVKSHAQLHLATTEAHLIEPQSIGLKTLERHSTEYVPFYDNSVRRYVYGRMIAITSELLMDSHTTMDLNGYGCTDTSYVRYVQCTLIWIRMSSSATSPTINDTSVRMNGRVDG